MANRIPLIVHATHEAGLKVGGIGAVLDGILRTERYWKSVDRTILAGPMNGADSVEMERLTAPGSNLQIGYSSLHGIFDQVTEEQRAALQQVEQTFEVALLYARRRFGAYEAEVILVDATSPNPELANSFKYHVWEAYGIDSARYDWNPEFNRYFSSAQPLFSGLKAIGADSGLEAGQKCIIAHEWLGLPSVFAAQLNEPGGWRTIFYAHETASARRLVEEHSGHDTRFYNTMSKAQEWGLHLEAIFGNQDDFFKDPLIRQATRCDNIFAVGDLVVEELRFLGGDFAQANIDLVYNGIPAVDLSLAEKMVSRDRLQRYCETLLGYRPDYVFTHVTRLVLSKALWRDIRVLEHLDEMLGREGKQAVLFVLSTSVPAGRRPEWVEAWEDQYGWPLQHRADNGDLIGQETSYFFEGVEPFNRRAANCQVVFVNQFGWSRDRCGRRMPDDMDFMDIRKGSDLEFGQSIYEPFGIAQVEPLSFGTLCCVSNVCGCIGFADRVAGGLQNLPNLIVADYVSLPDTYRLNSPYDALWIDRNTRDWIESSSSAAVAQTIFDSLPRDESELQTLLTRGHEVARGMSWDVVVRDYLLPGIDKAMESQ